MTLGLTKKEIKLINEELTNAKNPLFFYDDDPDGVCSFILLYKLIQGGKGIIVKATPHLNEKFLHKVKENIPDKIFILDIPIVKQEFIDKLNCPTFWIDHHGPTKLKKVQYFNSLINNPNSYIPTTYMAYQINPDEKNLWIATVGCLADWHMPDFIDKFIKKYPHLLPKNKGLKDAVYFQPIGKLVRLFSFLLKGNISEVNKSIKVLTRIQSPEEILNQETPQGKFLYRKYEKINVQYEELLQKVKVTRSKLLLYNYTKSSNSFTTDLANELINRYPNKVIIITRENSGEMKCSIRGQINIRNALKNALEGIQGSGGGHEHACGAAIKVEDWNKFLKNFKRAINKNVK